MKGNPQIIDMLNARLSNEHAAIIQYTTHAAMLANWGYDKLAEYVMGRARAEMKHADALLDRILFLEGQPNFVAIDPLHVAGDVAGMFANDHAAEMTAIAGYAEGVELAISLRDFGTRDLMETHLTEEESHINAIEGNLSQIGQMGIQNYLPVNIEE
jgi:bacterioferritin